MFCSNHDGNFLKNFACKKNQPQAQQKKYLSGHLCHISAHFYKWPLIFFCATENKWALMEVATYLFKWPLNFKLRDVIVQSGHLWKWPLIFLSGHLTLS